MRNSTEKKIFLSLAFAQLLFGINYIASKVLLTAFPPMVWASIRSIATAAIFAVMALVMGRFDWRKGLRLFSPLVIFSLLSTCLNQVLFLKGLQFTTPVNSALLNTMIPVVTLFFVTLTGTESLNPRQAVGFVIALIGVLFLMGVEKFNFSDETFLGDVLTILNVIAYSLFLTFSRPFLKRHDGVWATTWMFIYGSIAVTLLAAPAYRDFDMPQMTPVLIGCAVFAVVGGTFLSYLLVNYSLVRVEASKVALFVYIQPVIASIAGWLWLGQEPTIRTVLSGFLVFLGVAMAIVRPRLTLIQGGLMKRFEGEDSRAKKKVGSRRE